MKTATKIFIILGMIMGCVLIYPVIVGVIALMKLDKATSKKELRLISVLTIIFSSQIGGVLMLLLTEEQLNGDNKEYSNGVKYQELEKLKSLYDSNAINEDEFLSLKEKALDERDRL